MSRNPSQSSAIAMTRKVTQLTLTFAIVVLLAGAAGLYFLNNMIADAQKTEAQKEAVVGSNRQIANRYQTALTTFSQSETKLQYLEASVPEKSYVPTLLQQLQHLAKSTSLIVNSVHPGPIIVATAAAPTKPAAASSSDSSSGSAPTPKPIPLSYSTMTVQLDVDGTYPDIMRFMYDLPRFPKILSVQSLSLHPGTGPGILSATVSLTAYVFDPTKDVTIDKTLLHVLQQQGIATPPGAVSAPTAGPAGAAAAAPAVTPVSEQTGTNPPIAGAGVQAGFQKAGLTPEARAVGVARQDAAIADEQSKGQGLIEQGSGLKSPAGTTPSNGQGGMR